MKYRHKSVFNFAGGYDLGCTITKNTPKPLIKLIMNSILYLIKNLYRQGIKILLF